MSRIALLAAGALLGGLATAASTRALTVLQDAVTVSPQLYKVRLDW